MSGSFSSSRRSRSRSPIDDYAKRSVLAKVPKSELKTLRVAIRRNEIIGNGPSLPLERSIDDPSRICSYVHYRKDKHKRPEPPIFGKGIKVNQDFYENRRVFTHEKERSRKSSTRNTRSRSRSKSRSRERSRKRSSSRRRSLSKHRSRSREHKYSSERRRYKDEYRRRSRRNSRQSRSASRSKSPLEYNPRCPMHGERAGKKKSLSPLRPGEYRPGHPDLALRNKRPRSRSRSRSCEGRSRSKRSQSKDDGKLASSSRDRSPGPGKDSRSSQRYRSPARTDKRDHRSKSRSPPDRYRRRSRSPYNNHSPAKRSYKGDKSRSPRRRSRSPHYKGSHGEHMHEEYGYDGWFPGPRIPGGRGGFPMQSFYAPAYYPRGMIPGPVIPPGHMLVPRSALMAPYGPYRPHLPIYNSGAVRPRGPRPSKPATVTSEKEKEGDGEVSQVVIGEVKDGNTETVEENAQEKSVENAVDENGDKENVENVVDENGDKENVENVVDENGDKENGGDEK